MENVTKTIGIFKDNKYLCNCIAEQYRIFSSSSYLFDNLNSKQRELSNVERYCPENRKHSKGGAISVLVMFAVFFLLAGVFRIFEYCLEYDFNIIFLIIGAVLIIVSILIPIIYFIFYKKHQTKKAIRRKNRLNQEIDGICSQLWQIYNSVGYKCIPFEYSDPRILEQLYGIAKEYNLLSVSDTINTYYRVQHIQKMNKLDMDNYRVQNCCCQIMKNYAVMKLLGPRQVVVKIHD